MQRLKIAFMASVMALATLLGAFVPQVAKADEAQWPNDVLVSSALARFEAQASGYDATTNKYKYRFTWLMPAHRTYSFLIDGKPFMPKVTANGTTETPYWFSPDITYTISIYPYANGKGAIVGQGSFKAPSVTPPTTPLTYEEELRLIYDYVSESPDLPKGTIKSATDRAAIVSLMNFEIESSAYSEIKQYFSADSVAMFDQTPLVVKSMDESSSGSVSTTSLIFKPENIKIYKGGQYASLKAKLKDRSTGRSSSLTYVFIKENGIWKFDYLQMFKIIFKEA